jgi:hypothetical protein
MRKLAFVVLAIAGMAGGAAWAAQSFSEPRVVVKVTGPFTETLARSLLRVLPPLDDNAASYRKPILHAAGTQRVGPGEQRVTLPVDGVVYEVVTVKPDPLGRLIPVAR